MSGSQHARGDGTALPSEQGSGQGGPSLAEATSAAHTAALRLLTVRARSRAELADRLRRRGFPDPAIDTVIQRLEAAGLLDDEAFAAAYATSAARRGQAASVLRRDLRARGVDADVADRAAADASPADEDADRCHSLAEAWLARRADLPAPVKARRLAGYLTRRGYPPAVVHRTVDDLVGDPTVEHDPDTDPPQT